MLRARDIFWAVVICAVLNLGWYYRPLWSARDFLREQGEQGFATAFAGHRYLDGQLVAMSGGVVNPMFTQIQRRRFNVLAEHLSWDGKKAEFVVRHVVVLVDGSPEGLDISQDLHVALERRGNSWRYRHFEIRDHGPLPVSPGANPFTSALKLTGAPGS